MNSWLSTLYCLDQNFLFTSKDEDSQLKAIDFGLSDFVKPGFPEFSYASNLFSNSKNGKITNVPLILLWQMKGSTTSSVVLTM